MTPSEPSNSFQFPEVRVVEASAGSGKTYCLAKRYIQLVFDPQLHLDQIPIRNILALTFTNKAAFEMKDRILLFLKRIALNQLEEIDRKEILDPLKADAQAAQNKAYRIMDDLIRHYNFFQVQTIDKFINALLSGCAFKIGLTANFKIKTNAAHYLEYSLDRLIDQISTDKDTQALFKQFLHNYLHLENRSGWFPKKDILSIITALFSHRNTYGKDYRESLVGYQDIAKMKALILDDMAKLRDQLPAETNQGFLKSLDKFLEHNSKGFDIDAVSDFFLRDDIPVKKDTKVTATLQRAWVRIRERLRALVEAEAVSLFNSYVQIFRRAYSGVLAESVKDDILFLEELNVKTSALFDKDYVTVEELYYRLATRFHHYLIDEFQDTSRLQWQNLDKMAEEALSSGGSLFYVGDRKQAIYGFRGGDVRLFDDIQNKFAHFNVRHDLLSNNYRSQKAIVEFNNRVFSNANLNLFLDQKEGHEKEKKKTSVLFDEEDKKRLEQLFHGSTQSYQPANDKGYVRVEVLDIDNKEERDSLLRERIIALIGELKKRFSYRDIAILTRSNKEVEQITNWLLEEGIQVESERTSNVKENYLIMELLDFLRFLDSPIDNLSFARFILGDLFAAASGKDKQVFHDFIFLQRKRLREEKDFYLYVEFRNKFSGEWDNFVDEFFKNVGLTPLYELVVSIYNRLGCLAHFGEYQGFFMHFLELIKDQEEEAADIASFLEYLDDLQGEDLYVNVSDTDAIKILTIHKAKGLEFPVVILPNLGMDIQVGNSLENQQSYVLLPKVDHIELLRLKSKYWGYSPHLYEIYAAQYKQAMISELNNIYVALTRPQYELYAFIPKRVGNSLNLTRFLIPPEIYSLGEPAVYMLKPSPKKNAAALIPPSVYQDWIKYLKEEYESPDELTIRHQRLKGIVLHHLLSGIGNLAEKSIDLKLEDATQLFPQITDWDDYRAKVKAITGDLKLKPFYYLTESEVFTEREIVNSRGHSRRLDRMIVSAAKVDILDYKSSRVGSEDHIAQMKEYQRIVAELYPDKKVHGFLLYTDTLTLEEVKE